MKQKDRMTNLKRQFRRHLLDTHPGLMSTVLPNAQTGIGIRPVRNWTIDKIKRVRYGDKDINISLINQNVDKLIAGCSQLFPDKSDFIHDSLSILKECPDYQVQQFLSNMPPQLRFGYVDEDSINAQYCNGYINLSKTFMDEISKYGNQELAKLTFSFTMFHEVVHAVQHAKLLNCGYENQRTNPVDFVNNRLVVEAEAYTLQKHVVHEYLKTCPDGEKLLNDPSTDRFSCDQHKFENTYREFQALLAGKYSTPSLRDKAIKTLVDEKLMADFVRQDGRQSSAEKEKLDGYLRQAYWLEMENNNFLSLKTPEIPVYEYITDCYTENYGPQIAKAFEYNRRVAQEKFDSKSTNPNEAFLKALYRAAELCDNDANLTFKSAYKTARNEQFILLFESLAKEKAAEASQTKQSDTVSQNTPQQDKHTDERNSKSMRQTLTLASRHTKDETSTQGSLTTKKKPQHDTVSLNQTFTKTAEGSVKSKKAVRPLKQLQAASR